MRYMAKLPNITLIFIFTVTIFCICTGCKKDNFQHRRETMQQRTIQEVLKSKTPELMSISGVVGTAIGKHKNELCIIVMAIQKTPELVKNIPSLIEGYQVIIKETGEIRSLDTNQ